MNKPTKITLILAHVMSLQMFLASIVLLALGGINYAITLMLFSITWMGMSGLFMLARNAQNELEARLHKLEQLAEERDARQPILAP